MQKDLVIEKLREQGCRITKQRRMLLDIILEENCSWIPASGMKSCVWA